MSAIDDIRSFYDRNTIAAFELDGKDRTVTIAAVERGELPKAGTAKKERKPLVKFKEIEKKFVLNPTNREVIAKLYGYNIKGWIGKQITLYPTKTNFGRDVVDCIRVRPAIPAETKGAA